MLGSEKFFTSAETTQKQLFNDTKRHQTRLWSRSSRNRFSSQCGHRAKVFSTDMGLIVHVQVNKANNILQLVRGSYEYLDTDSMKKLFTALIRPHLEFSNMAWAPRLEKDKKLIKGVQSWATKLVSERKELSYEERLNKMNLPSLYYRRARGDMIKAYKYSQGHYTVNEGPAPKTWMFCHQRSPLQTWKEVLLNSNSIHRFQLQGHWLLERPADAVITAPTFNIVSSPAWTRSGLTIPI